MKNIYYKSKLRRLILSLIVLSVMAFVKYNLLAQSQSYNAAVGLRIAESSFGITAKIFSSPITNFEGIFSYGSKSYLLTCLYEINSNRKNEGLNLFYGFGGHIGFFGANGKYFILPTKDYNNASVIGLDIIFGLNYKFSNAPIIIGIDVKPFIDFYYGTAIFIDGAISIHYTF